MANPLLHVQRLSTTQQVMVLGSIAASRTAERVFAPAEVADLFDRLAIPRPGNVSAELAKLERAKLLMRTRGHGRVWKVTPEGDEAVASSLTEQGVLQLHAADVMAETGLPQLGSRTHPLVPAALAPPSMVADVESFLARSPFDINVFGMTRFPRPHLETDPMAPALDAARDACSARGMTFHLASDQKIVDELWPNVTAHMWACRYGIAFFEDRASEGLNYNLTIEVGGMLMAGRRVLILKDITSPELPSDLVGHIYTEVDLSDIASISHAVRSWLDNDLRVI